MLRNIKKTIDIILNNISSYSLQQLYRPTATCKPVVESYIKCTSSSNDSYLLHDECIKATFGVRNKDIIQYNKNNIFLPKHRTHLFSAISWPIILRVSISILFSIPQSYIPSYTHASKEVFHYLLVRKEIKLFIYFL